MQIYLMKLNCVINRYTEVKFYIKMSNFLKIGFLFSFSLHTDKVEGGLRLNLS